MSRHPAVYDIAIENEAAIGDLFIRLQGGVLSPLRTKGIRGPAISRNSFWRRAGKTVSINGSESPYSSMSSRRLTKAGAGDLSPGRSWFWMVGKDRKFCDAESSNIGDFYHRQIGFGAKYTEA